MADLRIIDIGTTTTTTAADDYIAIDGITNGTRKILVDSASPIKAMGAMYITTPAATTPGDTTNFFKAAGTTALNTTESIVVALDMPANNRLRYTGTDTIHAHIAVTISFTAAANNQDLAFEIYRYDDSAGSGAAFVHSRVENKIGTGTDIQGTALHADCVLDQNDYIEVHLKNATSTNTVTLNDMYCFVHGIKL